MFICIYLLSDIIRRPYFDARPVKCDTGRWCSVKSTIITKPPFGLYLSFLKIIPEIVQAHSFTYILNVYTINTKFAHIISLEWHYNKGRLIFFFFSAVVVVLWKWKRNVGLNPIEIDGAPSIILFKHVSHGRFTVCRFKQHQCVVTFVQIIRSIEVNIVYQNKHTTFKNLVNNLKTRWREVTHLLT